MGVVGEERTAADGHGAIDDPVVAALLGGEENGANGLPVGVENVAGDGGEVETLGDFEGNAGLDADELERAREAIALDVFSVGDLAGEVAGHGESGDAAQTILRRP